MSCDAKHVKIWDSGISTDGNICWEAENGRVVIYKYIFKALKIRIGSFLYEELETRKGQDNGL